jgi:hypothetical protein
MNKKITDQRGSVIGYIRKDNIGETVLDRRGHILGFTSNRGGTFTWSGHRISQQSVPGLLFRPGTDKK